MEEQLISFETAVLAKEKGFNIETLHFYVNPGSKMFGIDEHNRFYPIERASKKLYNIGEEATLNTKNVIYAPTQSLLQKWLREKHNCVVEIHMHSDSEHEKFNNKNDFFYYVEVNYYGKNFDYPQNEHEDFSQSHFNTYEEALEKGLEEALKLI